MRNNLLRKIAISCLVAAGLNAFASTNNANGQAVQYGHAQKDLPQSAQKEELPEFNIENPAVAEYMATSTATLSRTRGILGQEFFDMQRSYRPDQPRAKTIHFSLPNTSEPKGISAATKGAAAKGAAAKGTATKGAAAKEAATKGKLVKLAFQKQAASQASQKSTVIITMSENEDMSWPVLRESVEVEGLEGSYGLKNMVPGHDYYYSVSADGRTLTKGAFKATGQMRMIAIDNGFNIRDLGGWTGWNGNKVRYELLYRGGSLGGTDKDGNRSDLTDSDRAELKRIGIRALLDLRDATNSGKYAGESSLHSYSYGASTLLDADYNNTMTDYGAYNQDESVVADLAWIIHELRCGRPVYFNCRQGADRTGTIAFIIEGLLGCYGEDQGRQMGMDYELTGFSQANLVDNIKFASSYRSATEAYGNRAKLFSQLLSLEAPDVELGNVQEKCYYYLNRLPAKAIDKDDLDWFVNYMLGLCDIDGVPTQGDGPQDHGTMILGLYHAPSWARSTGVDLKELGESMANVVNYVK